MLEELVERYHVSVVLCTATQPVLEGDDGYFQGFKPGSITDIIPVAKSLEHFAKLKRVEYDLSAIKTNIKWSWEELTDRLNANSSALVVLNTRKDALKVIDILANRDLQPYIVSIRQFEFRKHRQSIEQPIAGVKFYIWTGTYDPIKGLPILGDPSDSFLLKGEDSVV